MTQVTARAAILPAGANSPGAVQDASGAFRYGSVCSGIEAASVAWEPLGWRPAFFSEIDPFPRAVLAHRFPEVPLHGDFTTIGGGDYGTIDLLVGGTPCQSFSVAGLRRGLGDDRGNLAFRASASALQGFPDDWTVVPYRGKPAADGPRYKALGNSMAVNCMRWIGRRIDLVERIAEAAHAA